MKKFILFVALAFTATLLFAQLNTDSVAYQLQRKKINAMLAARTAKFSKYDESLKQHTGIFGLQTKKDIRRSNDILMDIVKADDSIYRELKILLEYRAFQQKQVQTQSKETESATLGYMSTINRQRAQLDALRADSEKQEQQAEKTKNTLMLVIIALALVALIALFGRRRTTPVKGKSRRR
ncbi:MAG TPA: hypothetical protein VIM55_09515 [Mucilaginibacter sp.]